MQLSKVYQIDFFEWTTAFSYKAFPLSMVLICSHPPQDWNNPYMTWKPSDYGGVKEINIPPEMIWVPDIILYNK